MYSVKLYCDDLPPLDPVLLQQVEVFDKTNQKLIFDNILSFIAENGREPTSAEIIDKCSNKLDVEVIRRIIDFISMRREAQSRAAVEFLVDSREFRNMDIFCTNLFSTTAKQIATKTNTAYYDRTLFWTVSEVGSLTSLSSKGRDKVVGIAMATLSNSLILSPMPKEALFQLLAGSTEDSVFSAVYNSGVDVSDWGAAVPCGLEELFLKTYEQCHPNIVVQPYFQENIYKLENSKLVAPSVHNGVPIIGEMRRLYDNESDINVGIAFYKSFTEELQIKQEDLESRVKYGACNGTMFVWEIDEEPAAGGSSRKIAVSFAGHVSISGEATEERVARIAPVFTAREARGRGYAGALTAALAKHLVDGLG